MALLALACDEHGNARRTGLDGAAKAGGGAAGAGSSLQVFRSGEDRAEPTKFVTAFASSSPQPLEANGGSGGTGVAPQPIVAPYGISLVCGDAIVGATEECDDGPGAAVDACTADCTVRDQPVVALGAAHTVDSLDRYLGAGRHPVSGLSQGFATTFMEVGHAEPEPTVAASLFNIWGQRTQHVTVSTDASPIDDANPVVAALPDGGFAFAWGDFDGDGSDLGVALRHVAANGSLGSLLAANGGAEFSQRNPDILWTGTELVVAWEDYADAFSGPDLRYRTFDEELNPTLNDVTLAGSELPEAAVALAAFNGGWAAAYREGTADGKENIVVRVGAASFRVEPPFQGGPLDDRPALVELDATHVLLVFSVGTDPAPATGVHNVSRLRYAVIDVAGSATQASQALAPLFDVYTGDLTVSQMSPAAAPAPDGSAGAFVSWRSEARPGDAIGDQIWLKFVTWNAATATLTATEQEWPIPRPWAENLGDQRRPQLAAVGLPPSGALAMAWDDYSHSQGAGAGDPDVVVRYAPSRAREIHTCSPVTVTADATAYHNVYTAVPGANLVWTANATCTIAPQYQFWFRSPSDVWSLLRDWSTTNTYNWNTAGLALGIWDMQVWVRDIGYAGSPAYQANAGRRSELNASAACTSASSTAAPNPIVKGNTVTFVNTAGSCPSPEFLVYHLAPGGTWQIISEYGAANSTYLWDSTSAITGQHRFQIRARTQGSVVSYHAYSNVWVTVTAP